jgi:hypothetical protein
MPSFGPAQRPYLARHRGVAFEDRQRVDRAAGLRWSSSATICAEEDPNPSGRPAAQSGIAIPPMEGAVTDKVGDPSDAASP